MVRIQGPGRQVRLASWALEHIHQVLQVKERNRNLAKLSFHRHVSYVPKVTTEGTCQSYDSSPSLSDAWVLPQGSQTL